MRSWKEDGVGVAECVNVALWNPIAQPSMISRGTSPQGVAYVSEKRSSRGVYRVKLSVASDCQDFQDAPCGGTRSGDPRTL